MINAKKELFSSMKKVGLIRGSDKIEDFSDEELFVKCHMLVSILEDKLNDVCFELGEMNLN